MRSASICRGNRWTLLTLPGMQISQLRLCKAVEKSYTLIMYGKKVQMISNKIKTWIEEGAPQIEFKYAHIPRGKPSARLRVLVGEIATSQPQLMLQSHYRIYFYHKGLGQIIVELKYRFQSKDNDILCALGDICLGDEPKISKIANFYDLIYDLIECDRRLFTRFLKDQPEITIETASDLVDVLYKHELKEFLPHFSEIAEIFAAISASSCTAERSFSTLRRLKNGYLSTIPPPPL